MTTTCCASTPLTVRRPHAPHPWLAEVQRAWAAWRESSRRRAELRALEQLGDSTRRDLGLPERGPLASQRMLWHHERGQW